jgi:ATP:corrinoid adenosyltransferase
MIWRETIIHDEKRVALRTVLLSMSEIYDKIKSSESAKDVVIYTKAINKLSRAYSRIVKVIERTDEK